MKRDFLTLADFSKDELFATVDRACELKELVHAGKAPKSLQGKVLGMVFEKSSTRTMVSFDVGMYHLGGHAVYLNQQMSQLGRGESYADTARVLSRYVNMLIFRTYSHDALVELAKHASVPVINGLTDAFHPCQVVADLATLKQHGKSLKEMVVSYVGDGNNMTHSWMVAAHMLGFELRVATPVGYEVDAKIAQDYHGDNIKITNDPKEAVKDCDAVNTDTWFSMGQEVSDEKREAFKKFQLNTELLSHAKSDAIVLHCLPAHRGEEITDEVIDGKQSVVFDEAENRLYAQMAIMEKLVQ
jgi:ornithine carbamoyltransferase